MSLLVNCTASCNSHDRTPGGGRREKAEAYDMLVDEDSVSSDGFTGRYRLESQQRKGDPYIEVQYEGKWSSLIDGYVVSSDLTTLGDYHTLIEPFQHNSAPGIIRQTGMPRGLNSSLTFGAALHCMPLSLGRSRLLFRTYVGGLPPVLKLLISGKPAFLRNLNSCKILEQDAGLITTQEDYFKRQPNRRLQDSFLLLRSADVFVKSYRQWLDQVGHGMPWFQGLATKSKNVDDHLTGFETPPALDPMFHRAGNYLETRYHRHVMHCPTTRRALARVQQTKRISVGVAIAAITLSCAMAPLMGSPSGPVVANSRLLAITRHSLKVLVPVIPLSCIVSAMLHQLEQRFFVSFKRKEQMRAERGNSVQGWR